MKAFGLAASIVALMSSGAIAADAHDKGSTKDGGDSSGPVVVNWTGLYIGGSVGHGKAHHNPRLHDFWKDYCTDNAGDEGFVAGETAFTKCEDGDRRQNAHTTVDAGSNEIGHLDGLNTSGLVGDGRIGFDVQRGRFVFGVFGAYGFNNMEADGSGELSGLGDFSLEKGDEWSVGGRAGILVNPRTLAYIMAAYTQTDYELTLHGSGDEATRSRETTFSGVTVGGGVEFALTGNVFLGIEGTHTFYGKETIFDEYDAERNVGTRFDDELGETKVLGTLKIKLNTGLGGVID